MPTKGPRFGIQRVLWQAPQALSDDAIACLRALGGDDRFIAEVERLADWYRLEKAAQALEVSPREAELSLERLAKELRRLAAAAPGAKRELLEAETFARLRSMSPACRSALYDAELERGFSAPPSDADGLRRMADTLEAAARTAATWKSPAAKQGARLERQVAIQLREIFRAHGLRFYATRSAGYASGSAIEVLGILIPRASPDSLEKCVRAAIRNARG